MCDINNVKILTVKNVLFLRMAHLWHKSGSAIIIILVKIACIGQVSSSFIKLDTDF